MNFGYILLFSLVIVIGCLAVSACALFLFNLYNIENSHVNSLQIYIAGKYSGNVTYNVKQAEYYGMLVADKCNYPLVPHLLGYMSQENHTYIYWTTLDDIALEKSDALFIISHSKGSDAELELAKKLGKPIYYSIDDVPNRCN